MNFEKDRLSPSWAQIALFADLTWAADPPDDFIIANRRLWNKHCYIAQLLEESNLIHSNAVTQRELPGFTRYPFCGKYDQPRYIRDVCSLYSKRRSQLQTFKPKLLLQMQNAECHRKQLHYNAKSEGGHNIRDRIKAVASESKLQQNAAPYYYEGERERSYSTPSDDSTACSTSGRKSETLECWMLPEVEYWCRKMMETSSSDRRHQLRNRLYNRRRQDDSERAEEYNREVTSLTTRVDSVRSLWHQPPSPPRTPRKMRARRRKPRRLATSTPPPFNLQAAVPLVWKPNCKLQFQSSQQRQKKIYNTSKPATNEYVTRTSANKWPLYRGTNVSRYTPTSQRPLRYFDKKYTTIWPKINVSSQKNIIVNVKTTVEEKSIEIKENKDEPCCSKDIPVIIDKECNDTINENVAKEEITVAIPVLEKAEESALKVTASEIEVAKPNKKGPAAIDHKDTVAETPVCLEKKRLYSTVLSTQPTITPIVKTTKKSMIPGLIKLNPKIISTTRIRLTNVDDLEKEALEQYKASDESIDSKFHELEKQAVEQYSTSNSNTSCSSGNSAEKSKEKKKSDQPNKKNTKFCKDKVNTIVITSQTFSEQSSKGQASSLNLKNFQTPPRGDKKDQKPKPNKNQRKFRKECQRAASDTDYEFKELKNHKGSKKWMLRITPKKRHLKVCASDTSDEESRGLIKVMNVKGKLDRKVKKYDKAGGDLNPVLRKSS